MVATTENCKIREKNRLRSAWLVVVLKGINPRFQYRVVMRPSPKNRASSAGVLRRSMKIIPHDSVVEDSLAPEIGLLSESPVHGEGSVLTEQPSPLGPNRPRSAPQVNGKLFKFPSSPIVSGVRRKHTSSTDTFGSLLFEPSSASTSPHSFKKQGSFGTALSLHWQ